MNIKKIVSSFFAFHPVRFALLTLGLYKLSEWTPLPFTVFGSGFGPAMLCAALCAAAFLVLYALGVLFDKLFSKRNKRK